MAHDEKDLTEEEMEHIAAMQAADTFNGQIFEGIREHLSHKSNPKFVEGLKGTIFQNNPDIAVKTISSLFNKRYDKIYENYSKSWTELFGSPYVHPFRESANSLISRYLDEALYVPVATNKNYARDWLKFNLIKERQKKNLKRG